MLLYVSCDPTAGQHAFVGMGFSDRGDAFDFNVALQDHFKLVYQHPAMLYHLSMVILTIDDSSRRMR